MPQRREISAGLLAFRRTNGFEFLLAHPGGPYWAKRDTGSWTIPKGNTDPGAELLATAQREFSEETGFVAAEPFIALKPVKQKSGKIVHAFAFEGDFDPADFTSNAFEMEWPPRSGKKRSFPEIDRLGWFMQPAAEEKLIAYQRPFLWELLSKLEAESTS